MKSENLAWFTKLSVMFANKYRITFLFFLATLVIGFITYFSLLKREGFPPIEFPGMLVQVPYFVNDQNKVNEDVTIPIESAIQELEEINQVNSTSTDNFSVIFVQFNEEVKSEEGLQKVREKIRDEANLPETAEVIYQTFNAAAIDGDNDLLFTISSNDKTTQELQELAQQVALEVKKSSLISNAEVIELISEQTNPITGELFKFQSDFNRVGFKKDGELLFENAVAIGVKKKGDAGTIELSEAVKNQVQNLIDDETLNGITVRYGGDFADSLRSQISSLEESAIGGMVAVLVVLFFCINWRASIVTAIFIPTTLAATFIGLYLIGYSLNVLSLFGLILVLGLFVDDATVIVEAIDYQKKKGRKGINAIKEALQSVGSADIIGTLTTLLVFIPLAFVSGILGDFIRLIPITVILALALSLVIALTVMPLLTNIIIIDASKKERRGISRIIYNILYLGSNLVFKLGDWISKFVNFYLSNKLLTILVLIVSVVLISVGGFFAGQLEFTIFPSPKDTDEITLSAEFPLGNSLEQSQEVAQKIESKLVENYEDLIEEVNYFTGNESNLSLRIKLTSLKTREVTSQEIIDKLNSVFQDYSEAKVKVDLVSIAPSAGEYPYATQIYGEDVESLTNAAEDLKSFLEGREVEEGISISEVKIENLDNIVKRNGKRFISINAKFDGEFSTATLIETQNIVQEQYDSEKLESLGLTEDAFGYDLGQESENISSFNSSIFAFIIALVLMYIVLVIKFDSLLQPLLIFVAIPLSFPGLFPGLYLTNNAMSFFVVIGLTGLIGIVVNNTIMLVDFANQARSEGKTIKQAIVEAVKLRFRPLITTSLTSVAGLAPLALQDPFWESLAFTIIFGLISSTTLVIFVFPAYYAVVEKVRDFKRSIWLRLNRA